MFLTPPEKTKKKKKKKKKRKKIRSQVEERKKGIDHLPAKVKTTPIGKLAGAARTTRNPKERKKERKTRTKTSNLTLSPWEAIRNNSENVRNTSSKYMGSQGSSESCATTNNNTKCEKNKNKTRSKTIPTCVQALHKCAVRETINEKATPGDRQPGSKQIKDPVVPRVCKLFLLPKHPN